MASQSPSLNETNNFFFEPRNIEFKVRCAIHCSIRTGLVFFINNLCVISIVLETFRSKNGSNQNSEKSENE